MNIKGTIIKAMSLGIGLAIGLIMIAKVCYQMSYDTCYRDADQIYKIRTIYSLHGKDSTYDNLSGAVAPGFKDHVPGIETATRWTFIFNITARSRKTYLFLWRALSNHLRKTGWVMTGTEDL